MLTHDHQPSTLHSHLLHLWHQNAQETLPIYSPLPHLLPFPIRSSNIFRNELLHTGPCNDEFCNVAKCLLRLMLLLMLSERACLDPIQSHLDWIDASSFAQLLHRPLHRLLHVLVGECSMCSSPGLLRGAQSHSPQCIVRTE